MAQDDLTEPRIGWIIDGTTETPDRPVMLTDDGEQIILTVPWIGHDARDPYGRWFSGDHPVPDTLWFRDSAGTVALVRCRRLGSTSRTAVWGTLGDGRVAVDHAVISGRPTIDYQQVHMVRTRPPLLTAWTGLRNLSVQRTTDEVGRVQGVTATVGSTDPIHLGGDLALTVKTGFASSESGFPVEAEHRVEMRQWAEVVTSTVEETDIGRHLDEHAIVRHLVAIAAWEPAGVSGLWVGRTDDQLRLRSGREIDQWRRVLTHVLPPSTARTGKPRFLFLLGDIGVDGMRRWIDLWERYGRGLRPLVSMTDRSMFIETQVLQAGAGLEAIGFQLALDDGLGRDQADSETHHARLSRIVADLPPGIVPGLDQWPKASSDAYNAVKHAGRDMPSVGDLLRQARQDQMIFRVWVASRLGMDHDELARRALDDPLAAEVIIS